MKKTILTLTLILVAVGGQAQDKKEPAKKEPTAQQALMGTCNTEAKTKDLKGEDRKKFMSTCLSDGKRRQQQVMKSCNAEAKGKTGGERKKFMSECLKK